jgi:hypothetical protein
MRCPEGGQQIGGRKEATAIRDDRSQRGNVMDDDDDGVCVWSVGGDFIDE